MRLFIEHQSCVNCHPWVYMQAIQFNSSENIGTPLHFSYSISKPSWSDSLEYKLPGLGHSVDASVETRIAKTGPFSFIQKFTFTEEDKIEWWGFKCENSTCETAMREYSLPKERESDWKTGIKI